MKAEGAYLRTVEFHKSQVLKIPQQADLPTLQDADEYKLPAMDKLLRQMREFYVELKMQGLQPQKDQEDRYPYENMYRLTDIEYEGWPEFEIFLKSNWFNPKHTIALHGDFSFCLDVTQDGYEGRHEIADWINIQIKYLNTTPISFASQREHVRTLGFFYSPQGSYFHDLPMKSTTMVSFNRLDSSMNFKTDNFVVAVDDACRVMQKIIRRKKYLKDMS